MDTRTITIYKGVLKMFGLNKKGLSSKQSKSIKNLSICQEDIKTWTNYYSAINNLSSKSINNLANNIR